MRCVRCAGETESGTTIVAVERGDSTIVIKHVPAHVCADCGEDYLDEATMREVEREVEAAAAAGAELLVRDFRVAC